MTDMSLCAEHNKCFLWLLTLYQNYVQEVDLKLLYFSYSLHILSCDVIHFGLNGKVCFCFFQIFLYKTQ